jgi:hypothetical protein
LWLLASIEIPFSFIILCPLSANLLFPLSSNSFRPHKSIFSVVFTFPFLFHSGRYYFFVILSLFVLLTSPLHVTVTNLPLSVPCNITRISEFEFEPVIIEKFSLDKLLYFFVITWSVLIFYMMNCNKSIVIFK